MVIHAARLVILTISVVFLGKDCTSIIDLFTGKLNFSEEIVKKGFSLLRTQAASETLTNLLVLSEKRRGMVSERFLCCYI